MTNLTHTAQSESPIDPIGRTWWSWVGALGGYVAAQVLGHARSRSDTGEPRALHLSFLKPVTDGRLAVSSRLVRQGRNSAFVTSTLTHDDVPAVLGTALFGASAGGPEYQATGSPVVPGAQECADTLFPVELVPFSQHLEFRMATDAQPMAGGSEARMAAWMRLRSPFSDPAHNALVLLDAMPPALYAVMTEPAALPTAEMSVHFTDALSRAKMSDWSLVQIETEQSGDGWCVDASQVWDSDGTLLAMARQTRRVLA